MLLSTTWIIQYLTGDMPWMDISTPIPTETDTLKRLDMFRKQYPDFKFRVLEINTSVSLLGEP